MEKRRTKVDPMKYAAIRPKYELGHPVAQLAKEIGVKPQTLRAHASRNKWVYGSMTADAMEKAKSKALLAVTATYDEIVKEVNERQLKKIRRASDILDALIIRAARKLQWAEEKDRANAEEAEAKGKPIPAPVDTLRELYAVAAGIQGLRVVFMEIERLILGIKEGALQKDEGDGVNEMTRILSEARAEFECAEIMDEASIEKLH